MTDRRAEFMLLAAAAIWGGGFVAQRESVASLGPLTFTSLRFALGCLTVLAFDRCLRGRRRRSQRSHGSAIQRYTVALVPGCIAGTALVAGAVLQQFGMVETSASKAGFLTGTYVLAVPLFGLALGQRPRPVVWVGVVLVLVGLGLISGGDITELNRGDALVLAGAMFWAVQVQLIGRFAPRCDPFALSAIQFAVVAVATAPVALALEQTSWRALQDGAIPLLYGGVAAIGIAFTLQVLGQVRVAPTRAGILMSTESLFAAAGGVLLLEEGLTAEQWAGCGVLFLAALLPSLAISRADAVADIAQS